MEGQSTSEGFVPLLGHEAFACGEGLEGIERIVSLGERTCTRRGADHYLQAAGEAGRSFDVVGVGTFEAAMERVRRDVHAAMLIPAQHELQRRLETDEGFEHVASQHFALPNPGLHVATPERNASDRTYLWTLPALYPLVQEAYGDEPPFEEVIAASSTQDAAFHCGKLYGGAYCVTNDDGLKAFDLQSVHALRHIVMKWFLYRKARRGK